MSYRFQGPIIDQKTFSIRNGKLYYTTDEQQRPRPEYWQRPNPPRANLPPNYVVFGLERRTEFFVDLNLAEKVVVKTQNDTDPSQIDQKKVYVAFVFRNTDPDINIANLGPYQYILFYIQQHYLEGTEVQMFAGIPKPNISSEFYLDPEVIKSPLLAQTYLDFDGYFRTSHTLLTDWAAHGFDIELSREWSQANTFVDELFQYLNRQRARDLMNFRIGLGTKDEFLVQNETVALPLLTAISTSPATVSASLSSSASQLSATVSSAAESVSPLTAPSLKRPRPVNMIEQVADEFSRRMSSKPAVASTISSAPEPSKPVIIPTGPISIIGSFLSGISKQSLSQQAETLSSQQNPAAGPKNLLVKRL